jgi:hypothetical protein
MPIFPKVNVVKWESRLYSALLVAMFIFTAFQTVSSLLSHDWFWAVVGIMLTWIMIETYLDL